MATNPKLSTAARNGMGDDLISRIGNACLIEFYDGTQPAGPGTAVSTQTKLGTLTGGSPFAGSTSSGVVTANSITQDSSADATGTATWARIKTSGGTAVLDLSVGTSSADIILNTTSIVSGGPITMTALTITMPGG